MGAPSPTFLNREFACLRQPGRNDVIQINFLFAHDLNNYSACVDCKCAENTSENSCKLSADVEHICWIPS